RLANRPPVARAGGPYTMAEGGAVMRWGIMPAWSPTNLLLNAKAEPVADEPTFRRRRCLVPVDGLFEWGGLGPRKPPRHSRLRHGSPCACGGLFEPAAERPACASITTGPNELVRPVHDRMPVIPPREAFGLWLDPDDHWPEARLVPFPADLMAAVPVSTRV